MEQEGHLDGSAVGSHIAGRRTMTPDPRSASFDYRVRARTRARAKYHRIPRVLDRLELPGIYSRRLSS